MGRRRMPMSGLEHVLWIGGSPCSGKTSVAESLATRYGLRVYHCDEHFAEHSRKATPEEQPTLWRLNQMSWDEIWMRPVDLQVQEALTVYREEFPMIVADLLAMPRTRPIVAEGTALLPDSVAAVLDDPRRAVWLFPSEGFQRQAYPQRGEWVQAILQQCTDPEEAWERWMERDVRFAHWVAEEARQRGYRVLWVESEGSLRKGAQRIEAWFRPFIKGASPLVDIEV